MRREPFASETINIDRDGLRVTPGGPANPMRILSLFGGSTMWGTGVDDAHTISALVQRLFPDAAVVNYGQSAFVSAQNRAALLKRISLGAPVGTWCSTTASTMSCTCAKPASRSTAIAFTYFLEEAVRLCR